MFMTRLLFSKDTLARRSGAGGRALAVVDRSSDGPRRPTDGPGGPADPFVTARAIHHGEDYIPAHIDRANDDVIRLQDRGCQVGQSPLCRLIRHRSWRVDCVARWAGLGGADIWSSIWSLRDDECMELRDAE